MPESSSGRLDVIIVGTEETGYILEEKG